MVIYMTISQGKLKCITFVCIVAVLCFLLGWQFWDMGLRINPTPSLPKGLYRITSQTPQKGDLVSFCLEGDFVPLAKERGYLKAGSCPSGLQPLLKKLVGVAGDYVNPAVLEIQPTDSQGRPLSTSLREGFIPEGFAFVLAEHEGSFDSRYFGLVPFNSLQKVEEVFVFTPEKKGKNS